MGRAEESEAADATTRSAIAALNEHHQRVETLRSWLQGADFADERAWLDPEQRSRFERERVLFAWRVGELESHIGRVQLDHPAAFERWRKDAGLPPRPRPTWRVDVTRDPPRGDLFELEQRTVWRITHVPTGRLALEVEGSDELEYEGPGWAPAGGSGVAFVRLERDQALLLLADGREQRRPLDG